MVSLIPIVLLTGFCLFLVVAPICAIVSSVFLVKQDNKICANLGGYSFILYLPYLILINIMLNFKGFIELFIVFLLLLLSTTPHCVNLYIANKNQSKNLKYGAIFGIISSVAASVGFWAIVYGGCISGI
jgi:hypothetical protein